MVTSEEYRKRLYAMRPNIRLFGRQVGRDDPNIQPGTRTISLTYDLARDPQYQGLVCTTSSLTGRKISRFNHLSQTAQDLIDKIRMTRACCQKLTYCIQRCMGIDGLQALGEVTFQMDRKKGTAYHPRFLEYMKFFQEEDLVIAGAMTDVKGDRNLRPHQQADPDLYLHVVERRDEGIVVRGAKAHTTAGPYAEELLVLPTRAMTEKDADYAVSFAIPADTPGIHLIAKVKAWPKREHMKNAITGYGASESITVFDNVLVPWDRVFMCGEWEYAGVLASMFSRFHRHSYCGCKPAIVDSQIGASALLARYNGVEKSSHVRQKLVELITTAEQVYACGIASAIMGKKSDSGIFLPNSIYCNSGRYLAGQKFHQGYEIVHDIAGGLISTLPDEREFLDEFSGPYLQKYLKGKEGFSAEDRVRAYRLIEDITVSQRAAQNLVGGLHGGGSPEMERIAILADYDLEEKIRMARELAGIGQFMKEGKGSAGQD